MLSLCRHKRVAQIACLLAVFSLLALSLWILDDSSEAVTSSAITGNIPSIPSAIPSGEATFGEEAGTLSPQDLMLRPQSADRTHMPKLLHQSWKNSTLPSNLELWSRSCRTVNSGWEYVLWTDSDNAFMVEKYAPWFLETFNALPEPIERADASRNLYMYIFGGVYADLDTECLRPYDSLFENRNVPVVSHQQLISNRSDFDVPKPQRKAFLGSMHPDRNFHSGLPNAWMASTPAHPFWTLPLEYIPTHALDNKTPEYLTGPDALFDVLRVYLKDYAHGPRTVLDEHHTKSIWAKIYGASLWDNLRYTPQSVEVLPPLYVFPFNWADVPIRRICWAGQPKFDAETCKDLLDVDRLGAYSISYFCHSWDGDPFYKNE